MFKKILIANRGEIALRIIRGCKEMGIRSAAIYSEADKTSLHAKYADEAYYIGGSAASDSYLNKEKILELAKKISADAIHPGYGFFSENASFIKDVEDMGITFIGPSSKSVSMMGSKTAARQLMKKNGVPIVPGTTEALETSDDAIQFAESIGYPVLLKAASGGGGKGMRKVNSSSEMASAFESTKREALKAFADADVYIEKYIEEPKHIEVQIFGDKHGNYLHFFERECSIQRRHQKIIEEAPSIFVDNDTRKKITDAAIKAARACGYYNAGTVELLMDKHKNFYFLEMNTRLQVEHPVTEMITGMDLLKEQIYVAAGNKLSVTQDQLSINGHSIETRIYAEDPENNFLPSTGKLTDFQLPSGPGVRVDTGFSRGSVISLYYDPMIAKLVVWARTRPEAVARMKRALSEFHIAGVTTNIPLLKTICSNKLYNEGTFNINFIENELKNELNYDVKSPEESEKAAAIFLAVMKNRSSSKEVTKKDSDNNKWFELSYE